jgi:hypothetical protein
MHQHPRASPQGAEYDVYMKMNPLPVAELRSQEKDDISTNITTKSNELELPA